MIQIESPGYEAFPGEPKKRSDPNQLLRTTSPTFSMNYIFVSLAFSGSVPRAQVRCILESEVSSPERARVATRRQFTFPSLQDYSHLAYHYTVQTPRHPCGTVAPVIF